MVTKGGISRQRKRCAHLAAGISSNRPGSYTTRGEEGGWRVYDDQDFTFDRSLHNILANHNYSTLVFINELGYDEIITYKCNIYENVKHYDSCDRRTGARGRRTAQLTYDRRGIQTRASVANTTLPPDSDPEDSHSCP